MIRTRHRRATTTSDGSTVTVCLVPWDTPEQVTDNGRDYYNESFARGGLNVPDRLLGELEHDGQLIGRALAVDDRADGLYADVRISASTAGRDFLADLDAGIYEAVSIDFDADPAPVAAGASISRSGAQLRRFAFTTDPQHQGARVVGRRSNTTGETMDTDTTTTDDDLDEETDEETDETEETETEATDAAAPAQRSRQRSAPRPGARVGGARVGARFRSVGHFALAAARGEVTGDELARYQRALATTTTAAQTGLVHEEWIREIIDLQASVRPTVEMFSTRDLPAEGDSVKQPKVTTRATAGKQDPENSEIASRAVVVTPVTFDLETFAGGQGMSLQTALRSSPEYVNEVLRLHLEALGEAVNTAAAAAVVAGIPVPQQLTQAGTFNAAVNAAVAGMYGTLRRFPTFMLLSVSKWQELADLEDSDGRPIYPALSAAGSMGTVSLQSDTGEQRNLRWRIEPELAADTAVVAHAEAFRTFLGPVATLTADVPATLARDTAVYQFAAMGVVDTRGLYEIGPVA